MKRELIEEFVSRPRQPVESLKQEWWASRGAASSLEAGHALLEHARRVDPSFPCQEYLDADLAHHVLLKQRLDRASKTITGR